VSRIASIVRGIATAAQDTGRGPTPAGPRQMVIPRRRQAEVGTHFWYEPPFSGNV
jgi:hypothetical protein